MAKFYFAEVRDIEDPLNSGRVKVRLYMHHDDEQTIPDSNLPWAMPLQPITSAATHKIGIIPTGLIVGSRVIVAYMDNDTAEQYPIIMGSFARAGAPAS